MEEIALDLKESEMKQIILGKAFEKLHARCKEFGDQLNLTQNSLQIRKEEMELREKQLEEKERNFESVKESKEQELVAIENVIKKKLIEVEQVKSDLECVSLLVKEKSRELVVKEKRVLEVKGLIGEKERELDLIGNRIGDGMKRLNRIEECIMDMDSKVEAFKVSEKSMEDWCSKLDLKEKEVEGLSERLALKGGELCEPNVEELHSIAKRVGDCLNEVEWREREVKLRQFESSVEELSLREKTVEEEKQRLDLILKSAEKRGKHLDSLQHLVEERGKDLDLLAHKLERKEKELLQQAQDLELRRRQFDLLVMTEQPVDISGANNVTIPISGNNASLVARNAATLPSNVTTERQESLWARNAAVLTSPSSTVQDKPLATLPSSAHPAAKDELATQSLISKVEPQWERKRKRSSTSSSSPKLPPEEARSSATFLSSNLQSHAIKDASNVSGFPENQLCGNHFSQNELATSLRLVPDPAKLVLSNMQKSLAEYLRNGSLDESVMSTNISVLKELMSISPHVGSHLKVVARNLAVRWKEKMRGSTDINSMESLAFLLFAVIYGLESMLNTDEIVKVLGLISQNKRAVQFCETHDFAAKVTDYIMILIQRKEMIEAVKFINTFKFNDKLPPTPLLKEYVEDAKKHFASLCKLRIFIGEKVKAVDNLLGSLRSVLQCIKDYNLESEYPSAEIEMQVIQLEKLKNNWRHFAPSSHVAQKDQRKRKEI